MSRNLVKIKYLLTICLLLLAVFIPSAKNVGINTTNKITVSAEEVVDPTLEEPESGEGESGGEENPEESPQTTFEGFVISTNIMTDEYLYSALLKFYKSKDPNYKGSSIYSDMFKDFTDINIDNKNITSLVGMEKLELDNLVSFSANLNNINSFETSTFKNIDRSVFTSLSLAGNELGKVNLDAFDNLTYLDLSSNRLTYLDLSNIEGAEEGTNLTINVANNNFDSILDLVLPQKRIGHISLNIINNNITDLTCDYFTDFYTMQVGIQGFKTEEIDPLSVDTKENFVIYKTGITGLAIEIYKDGEKTPLAKYQDSDITENFLRLELPVGEYKYLYTINDEPAFSRNDKDRKYLESYEFNILPQQATYTFTHKGKEYEKLGKVTGKVVVNLSSPEEGADIFYQVNGGEWVKGTSVECANGGNYTIKVKTVINGYESKEQSIWVRTSLNLYISDWVMLVLVVLLTLVLFLVVLPIISKKYFKKD